MYLIIGLGNPGLTYKGTRHNVGFMVVDQLCRKYHLRLRRGKGRYQLAEFSLGRQKVFLFKPLTYMNLSGNAVQQVIQHLHLTDLSRLLVVFDDINVPFGTVRLRGSGSAGGQRGMKSIIAALQSNEFPRLRIGIGDNFSDAVDHVLSPFTRREKQDLQFVLDQAAEAVETFISEGLDFAMSKYNRNVLEN